MARFGLGSLLVGAAALAVAGAAASGKTVENTRQIDKYNVNYDVDGNKLHEVDTLVKLSAKKNTYEWVRKGLNDAINSDGTVNRFTAFKTLASFYQVMKCIEEKPDVSDEELPEIMEKAAKKAAIHILVVNELTKKGDTTVKDELKTIFDGLKYHIYCDIYGNELSDDTSKIKICIKHGTGSMTERLRSCVKPDGTVDNPRMVISQFVN